MSQYFQWMILSSLTGSPIASLAALLIFWWSVDRFTVGILPSPFRAFARWRRVARLRGALELNPNDRRVRYELADLLISYRRHLAALEVLKPSVEAGDHDAATLFLMGVACLGAGKPDQGEAFLDAAEEEAPTFQMGAIDLERGRWRLARGEPKGALEPLQRFCQGRAATIEGTVLLARALDGTGEAQAAARKREEAWRHYLAVPAFQRRRERLWAWRAKPSRPIAYGLAALAVLFVLSSYLGPMLRAQAIGESQDSLAGQEYGE